jgi:hypothetical protein
MDVRTVAHLGMLWLAFLLGHLMGREHHGENDWKPSKAGFVGFLVVWIGLLAYGSE